MRSFPSSKVPGLLVGIVIVVTLAGCGANQNQPPPQKVSVAPQLTEAQKQFIARVKALPPAQQGEELKKNPEMTKDPLVMAQLRDSMMKR